VALTIATLRNPKLWHFDHPNLYRVIANLSGGHALDSTFGIRKIEIRNSAFYLNGERVRLMGVERMAGSNPEYGMAEPVEWIEHDHADMRALNCIYTRVHWPQDRAVLDWCDRHGMFIQTEVPTWGGATFREGGVEPPAEIMNNGIEQ
jgi:beta-glucuronidase